MKATLLNRLRMWWHCLTHLSHQEIEYDYENCGYLDVEVECLNCDYGKRNQKVL